MAATKRERTQLGEELARWLEGALLDPEGAAKMGKRELAELAGVSPDTVYRVIRGEGDGVSEKKLAKLAGALKVPPPKIVQALAEESKAPPGPETPLRLVAEAESMLARARGLLEQTTERRSDAGRAKAERAEAAELGEPGLQPRGGAMWP